MKEKRINNELFKKLITMKKQAPERIRELRKALKLSLEKFANETDLSFSLLSKAETGAAPVTEEMLEKISNRWKCPFKWLSNGEGEMTFEKSMKSESTDNPYKDYLVQKLEKDVVIWQEKYEQAWKRLEFLMDRLPLGKLKPVKETAERAIA